MKPMSIIAAADSAWGIGLEGKLPWRLPLDFKQFVSLTKTTTDKEKKNAVVMGRKCWESIPEKFRPLDGRINVVLSGTMDKQVTPTLIVCPSFEEAVHILHYDSDFKDNVESIWNIGGRQVYELGFNYPNLDKIYITKLDKEFETDVKFPSSCLTDCELLSTGETVKEKDAAWQLYVYKRQTS